MVPSMRKAWWRIALIVVVCLAIDMVGHRLGPELYYKNPSSIFENKGLFIPLISILFIVTFGVLAAVFVSIEGNLPGSRLSKGLRYGVAFGVLWLIGILGVSPAAGSPIAQELYTGMVDGSAVILLALLLGLFAGTDGPPRAARKSRVRYGAVPVVAAFYTASYFSGRWLLQFIPSATPIHAPNSLHALVIALGLGGWIGAMYVLLAQGSGGLAPFKQALWFGVVVFGIEWVLFAVFGFLFVEQSILVPLLGAGIDILFVVVAVWFFERLLSATSRVDV
jgi:hypothetical protein